MVMLRCSRLFKHIEKNIELLNHKDAYNVQELGFRILCFALQLWQLIFQLQNLTI